MLFRTAALERIFRGEITLAFRLWRRPTVKTGGRLRTAAGTIEILSVEVSSEEALSDQDAEAAGFQDRAALLRDLREGDGRTLYRVAIGRPKPDERVALREDDVLSPDALEALAARLQRPPGRPLNDLFSILQLIREKPGAPARQLASNPTFSSETCASSRSSV